MKKMMCIGAVISAFMLLMPLSALSVEEKVEPPTLETVAPIQKAEDEKNIFRVLNKETGEVSEMEAREYIFGVVAAEMPALYEDEALKAQAVASYTYAYCKRQQNAQKEYDITTDFNTDQSFKTREKAISDWGEKGEEYANKIQAAVDGVEGQLITYKNEPILAVYHAVSSGQTYSAKDVWGQNYDYLQSVSSSGDKLANKYMNVLEFSEDELSQKLKAVADKKDSKSPIIGEIKHKNNGLINTVKVYGEKISGSDFRSALGLDSTNFTFEKKSGKYIFTCYGYGHGVGMSQNGANYMAKQGYSYAQILSHYYQGTKIKD